MSLLVGTFFAASYGKTALVGSLQFMAALARKYLQLPLRQWGVGNVYLLVLSSWKVNIAENPVAVIGL